jgi:hypothetical protein
VGYLGTTGTYALAVSDAIVRAATDDGYGEEPSRGETWRENVIVKALIDPLVGEGPPRRTKYLADLYDMIREAETAARTISVMQRRFADDVEARLQNPDDAFMASLMQAGGELVGVRDQLAELRREMELVRMDPNLSADAKRSALWDITRDRNRLAREVVTALEAERQRVGSEPRAVNE